MYATVWMMLVTLLVCRSMIQVIFETAPSIPNRICYSYKNIYPVSIYWTIAGKDIGCFKHIFVKVLRDETSCIAEPMALRINKADDYHTALGDKTGGIQNRPILQWFKVAYHQWFHFDFLRYIWKRVGKTSRRIHIQCKSVHSLWLVHRISIWNIR